jgi:hypothetical protein
MEMAWSWDDFEVGKPLGREIKGDLSSFKTTSHRKAKPDQK